jgi:hypothetical protein
MPTMPGFSISYITPRLRVVKVKSWPTDPCLQLLQVKEKSRMGSLIDRTHKELFVEMDIYLKRPIFGELSHPGSSDRNISVNHTKSVLSLVNNPKDSQMSHFQFPISAFHANGFLQ